MKIILLRHGNRDLTVVDDGGLNQTGKEQATNLVSQLQPSGPLAVPTILMTSPKNRAKQTLLPLSQHLELPLTIQNALDERQNSETSTEFRSRIRNFLELLPKKFKPNEVLFLCSHADWLEEAMTLIPSDLPELIAQSGFACCETRSFEVKDKIWEYLK